MEDKRTSVLLIEDDSIDQMAFRRMVRDQDLAYDFTIAGSVSEAKSCVESGHYDIVIADYSLGDGTAFELFDSIRKTPVILVTGGGDEEIAVHAMKAGAYDYLIKDTDRNYLKVLPITVENTIKVHRAQEKNRMLSHAMMNIQDSVYITDMTGVITFVNRAFIQTYGYERREILSRKSRILWEEEEEEGMRAVLDSMNHGNWEGEVTHVGKDGRPIPVSLSVSVLRGDQSKGTALVAVARDIRERQAVAEEKRIIQKQLLQAQKMEAIGILTGGVAHDFNNLITAIHGCSELAMMGLDSSNPVYSDIKQIQSAAGRAADLTRQLLMFSRKHPISVKPLDLNTVIRSIQKMLGRLIGEDIQIETSLQESLWTILADPSTMDQVVMNIAINARDAMPEGGRLVIQTRNVELDEQQTKGCLEAEAGRFVRLTISDSGVGMDPEVQAHAFEPFFSTKGPGRGSGLGLSVVYGIVKQHDGWIDIYSEVGRGTEFRIHLPVVSVTPEESDVGDKSKKTIRGNGERILIVEDEEYVRECARRALAKSGYVPFTAGSAEEAAEIFRREEGCFHLVFSDVVLPDVCGVNMVGNFLSEKPGLHVLMSSGYTDHKSRWPVILERGFRFLAKPYALDTMVQTIGEIIRGTQPAA